MQPLKLITETNFSMNDFQIIQEKQEGSPRKIKVRGPYMMAEKENLNKRKYPYDDMKKECDRFNEQFIQTGRAWGELEHPDHAYINPDRVCHIISKLDEGDDKMFMGESIITASDPQYGVIGTPMGDIAASILSYGGRFGMSTRGVGRLEEGTVRDYKLSTVDLVSDPSIGNFVEGILEQKEFMIDVHGMVCEMNYEKLEKKLETLPNHERNQYIENTVREFLKNISNTAK